MSNLLKFANFLKQRRYALEDLKEFTELVEPVTDVNGWRGYRMKPLSKADRVSQRCQVLIQYTWHCRDYLKKALADQGVTDPGSVVNSYITGSPEAQIISYLANEHKHAEIDPNRQAWAVDLAPRLSEPFVLGTMPSFPHTMKPTVVLSGDSFPEVEFTGRAGLGDQVFEFTEFEWHYSCSVVDKDGRPLGNAWGMCEITFELWMSVVADHGIAV
jgi:hypothetical protein